MRQATQQEIDNFITYRANHVALVQKIGKVALDLDLSTHDRDKIEATGKWLNLLALRNASKSGKLKLSKEDKNELRKVSAKHALNSKHHAEYWDTDIITRNFDENDGNIIHATYMPKRYVAEMACDWASCALYHNQPIFDWYNKVIDKTLFLTDNQKEYLVDCLNKIQKAVKKYNLSYPGVEYDAEQIEPIEESYIYEEYRLTESIVESDLAEQLDNSPTIKTYRAMQIIDGKLYPPMSAKIGSELRQPTELGVWEQAEESTDNFDKNGKFVLKKGNGKTVPAAYNPYFHSSDTMLNDQFAEAQDRPNLVVVETEIPVSELESGYKANGAKDSVGKIEWKAGVIQSQLTGTRTVYLSRYDKPIRIVPDEEVALSIKKMLGNSNIIMPTNVVTPSLRKALENIGVSFVKTNNRGIILEGEHAGELYSRTHSVKNIRESREDNFKKWFGKSVVVDENGEPLVVYHGSPYKFDEFKRPYANGHYFCNDKEFASHIYKDVKYVYECYLKLEHPFVIDVCGGSWEDLFANLPSEPNKSQMELINKYYKKYGKEGLMLDELCEELINEDEYDGIIVKNILEGPNGTEQKIVDDYIAFKANQIKSVDNNGDFDPDKNNIYENLKESSQYHYWKENIPYDTLSQMSAKQIYETLFEQSEGASYDKYCQMFGSSDWCNSYLKEAKEVLYQGKSEPIKLYRTLALTSNQKIDTDNIGVCWAWDEEGSKYFSEVGLKNNLYNQKIEDYSLTTITATTTRDNIDWAESIFLHDKYPREHELRVCDTKKVKIDSINKLKESNNLTETDNFKKWFGNSKVVDGQGNPLIVYHGSKSKITTFNTKNPPKWQDLPQQLDFGTHFTVDEHFAYEYAGFDYNKVYACYLRIENPLIIENGYEESQKPDCITMEKAIAQGYDGIIYTPYTPTGTMPDGEIIKGNPLPKSFIVFEPNQIKSVNNNGNFSLDSDNIYESLNENKEQMYSANFKNWFGDWENDSANSSKVVDSEGKPLVVYHGSRLGQRLDVLDPSKGFNIDAIYHSASKYVAAHWSGTVLATRFKDNLAEDCDKINDINELIAFAKNEFQDEITLDEPYEITKKMAEEDNLPKEYIGWRYPYNIDFADGTTVSYGGCKSEEERFNKIKDSIKQECENVSDTVYDDVRWSTKKHTYANYLNIRNPLIVDANKKAYWKIDFEGQTLNTESIASIAKERGYDGVIIKNVLETDYENQLTDDYIVFKANQIKSATDNNGNFDPNSDRITESTDQIYTSQFKNWFGDWENDPANSSKGIDLNGKPKIFYHGSNNNFDIFSYDKSGKSNSGASVGFWFTDSKEFADNFSNEVSYNDTIPQVYEVYLNFRNPKIYETTDEHRTKKKEYWEKSKELNKLEKETDESFKRFFWYKPARTSEEKAARTIYDYYINYRQLPDKDDSRYTELYKIADQKWMDKLYQHLNDLEKVKNLKKEIDAYKNDYVYIDSYEQLRTAIYNAGGQTASEANFGGLGYGLNNKQAPELLRNKLIAEGYDSIIIKDTEYDSSVSNARTNTQYVMFYPNQIKSATRNNGNFSTESDNIYESKNNTGLSPVPPDYEVEMSKPFLKDKKNLRFTDEDINDLIKDIKIRVPRTSLGNSLYKFDFWPKRYNLSPSEGRVIFYKITNNKKVILLRGYHKSMEKDLSKKEKDELLSYIRSYK